jgi:hypothetical protein
MTHLLSADPGLVGNATVAACIGELRALCGYTGTAAGTAAEKLKGRSPAESTWAG